MKLLSPTMALLAGFALCATPLAASLFADEEAASGEKTVIQFTRPLKPGAKFDCDIAASYSRDFALETAGSSTPMRKAERMNASLVGEMELLDVNESGNPLKMRFKARRFDGAIDLLKADVSGLEGKTFIADLKPPVCNFSMAEGFDQALMTKDAAKLLSIIFRPATKGSMADVLGTTKPVGIGDKWTPPCKLLIESLAKRGIKIEESDFDGATTLTGRCSFRGIDCWSIDEYLQTKMHPSFDLRLKIGILLPCDPKFGGAVKISRTGVELVRKALPDNNPLSAGKSVEASVKDSMEAIVVPLSPVSDAR